jgi:hypothetical protein
LSWNASSGATTCNIYRWVSFGYWNVMTTIASTSHTDFTLEILSQSDPDVNEFFYHITAINSAGESSPSNNASVWGFSFFNVDSAAGIDIPEDFGLGPSYPTTPSTPPLQSVMICPKPAMSD